MAEQPTFPMPAYLTPDALRRICTQEEVAETPNGQAESMLNDLFIGVNQPRLLQALQLGLHESSKNHIFVAGISGPRVLDAIKTFVIKHLQSSPQQCMPLRDWCYIHNFDNPLEPIVIALDKGKGIALKKRMEKLLSELQERIPAALVRDEVVTERQVITLGMGMWWESERFRIIQEAKEEGVWISFEGEYPSIGLISRTQPETKKEGRIITPIMNTKELQDLPQDEREERIATRDKWIHDVNMANVEYQRRLREMRQAVIELDRRVVGKTVDNAFARVRITSSEHATSYAQKLKIFTVDNFEIFTQNNEQNPSSPHHKPFLPWTVNVLVDNNKQDIPPVLIDYNGTFENLVGRIGRIAGNGGVIYTDHTMITAGSLAQANNGYLIVDVENVLRNLGSYHILKRVLTNEVLKIEDIMSFVYGAGSMTPLQPMPIPLHVKVIMIGSRYLWSMLAYYDPEFFDHFELKAEIAPALDRTIQETRALAHATRLYAKTIKLLPFQDDALQRIVEHAGRLACTQNKLSADFRVLEPIVREASYLAEQDGSGQVNVSHVRNALERKLYRSNLYGEHMQRMIRDKKIILPLKGETVGQITILSVSNLGDIEMGFPGRLTCEWSMERPGFVSIQREAKLAGNILVKGELTVQKYLTSLFAKKYPLALNISYTAEQTYGMIDGDSASVALFYCIISALANVPIRQDVAITGSLSQRGEIQGIGGVNEKIEGFFESCFITGLTGTQGVIIPASNASDLMLNDRVLHAVRDGTFHVWAIGSIHEGMRILMGKEAGERKSDFTFTESSVYALVDKQLQEIARNAHTFFTKNDDPMI